MKPNKLFCVFAIIVRSRALAAMMLVRTGPSAVHGGVISHHWSIRPVALLDCVQTVEYTSCCGVSGCGMGFILGVGIACRLCTAYTRCATAGGDRWSASASSDQHLPGRYMEPSRTAGPHVSAIFATLLLLGRRAGSKAWFGCPALSCRSDSVVGRDWTELGLVGLAWSQLGLVGRGRTELGNGNELQI